MYRKLSTMVSRGLEGKVCVITASTDGIGYAIAKRLGLDGANIVVSSRKKENVEKAVKCLQNDGVKSSNILGVPCHVAKASDRQRLFDETLKKFGGIDALISNAAVNPEVSSVLDTSEEVWDKIFEVNVKASFLLAKEAKPLIIQRGGGSITFISSIGGYTPFDLLGAYSVSKTALFGLTKAASLDLCKDNIRVNCVAPGVIETKFSSALYSTEAAKEATLNTIPMRRLGNPDEIGSVVAFLVSDDASYITGETLVAAGGCPSRL